MIGSIVITMAGFGSRFRKAGYKVPKYQIVAHDRCLFDWSMLSLGQFIQTGWRFSFVMRKDDGAARWVAERCDVLGIKDPIIIEIAGPTDGQATTALFAGDQMSDTDQGFMIYNIDTHVSPRALSPDRVRGAGWLPCADLPGESWSFARVDDDLRAVELREKKKISNHATIGLYYFKSYNLYKNTYNEFYRDTTNIEAGERYIAPMYNHMITCGEVVYIETVDASDFFALGTPADVDAFKNKPAPALR